MNVLDAVPGIYRGTVEGIESGHCTARIDVRAAPGGCRTIDYEAVSDEHGLQHVEHALVSADALHVAFGEAAGVTVFALVAPGVYETAGEPRMRIHAAFDDGELSWAWHWGSAGQQPIERSRARCRRTSC